MGDQHGHEEEGQRQGQGRQGLLMLTKDDTLALLHLMLGEGRVRPVLLAHVIAWVRAARDPVVTVVD